jgi:nicotinamide-nucleotide amidase
MHFEELVQMAVPIGQRLKARAETIAIAESSAGGLLSAALLAVPGASAYFLGGGVVYTLPARRMIARIADEEMRGMRSASEPYAQILAQRSRENLGAIWGLAETGASGPAGNRYGDAAGHSCIAISGPVNKVMTLETGQTDRLQNMMRFTASALALLSEALG